MPEVFRRYGFSFFFYSREHEQIHIHVEGHNGIAIYDWNEDGFPLRESHGIKPNDLKKIKMAIDKNTDIIIKRWEEHFNG